LTRLKGPIRGVNSADDMLSEEDAKNAPREFMRLVNRMMSGDGVDVASDKRSRQSQTLILTQPHLFTTRGDPKLVDIIREV
jgi:hypothetical protein